MSEKRESKSRVEQENSEQFRPPTIDLDVGLDASTVADLLALTGRQWHVEYDSDPLREKNTREAYSALQSGISQLIETNTPLAREVLDIMATGTDWQKELAARQLVELLKREHELGETRRKLTVANNLVRIMHEEQQGKIAEDVQDYFVRLYGLHPAVTHVMIELVSFYDDDPSAPFSARWLSADIHKWFARELSSYFSDSDMYE